MELWLASVFQIIERKDVFLKNGMNTAPLQQQQLFQTPSEAQPHLFSRSLREKAGVMKEIKAIQANRVKKN